MSIDEFRELYERHVGYVAAGDMKSALAQMVQENLPTVFSGVQVPRADVIAARIVGVRADGDKRVGEVIYSTPGGEIGLRSIWEQRAGIWQAAALENFTPRRGTVMSGEPWGPSDDGLDQPYWDGLRAGELRLQRCSNCRTWIWGPQWLCGTCHAFDPSWEPVEPIGTVYSWSRSWYPFISELPIPVPYVTVLVELPAAGNRRVLGILTDTDTDGPAIRIGDRVAGWFEHDEGVTWPLLRWTPTMIGAQR